MRGNKLWGRLPPRRRSCRDAWIPPNRKGPGFLAKIPLTFALMGPTFSLCRWGNGDPNGNESCTKSPKSYKLLTPCSLGHLRCHWGGGAPTLSDISQLMVVKKRSLVALVRNTSPSFGCQGLLPPPVPAVGFHHHRGRGSEHRGGEAWKGQGPLLPGGLPPPSEL